MRVRRAQLWTSRAVGSQDKKSVPTWLRPELETNPSLPLGSLSERQPRGVPSELCVRDACSRPICTQSLGRTGQGSPAHDPGTRRAASQLGEGRACVGCGSATSCRLPCLSAPVHCLLTAGGVHKTSRCISPRRPDSLPSVGTLPRSLLSGQASSRALQPRPPLLSAARSVLLSKFGQLPGQAGGREVSEPLERSAASLRAAESPLSVTSPSAVGLVSLRAGSERRSGSQKKNSESRLGLCELWGLVWVRCLSEPQEGYL